MFTEKKPEDKQIITVEEFNKVFPVGSPVSHKGVQYDTELLTIVQRPAFRFKDGRCYFINSRHSWVDLSKIILEN